MSNVFPYVEGVACRACGATRAPASDVPDVCDHCLNSIKYSARVSRRMAETPASVTEDEINTWLAKKLLKDLARLKKLGVSGRCEAITWSPYSHQGYQCGARAIMHRDGHKVCASHGRKAAFPTYVDDHENNDYYAMLHTIIRDLASVDERFAETVAEALRDATA